MDFDEFCSAGQDEWRETFGLTLPTQLYLETNRDEIDKNAFRWQVQLTPMKVEIVDQFSQKYPTALVDFFDVPPPVLYMSGNQGIVESHPKLAIINSRTLSTTGKELLNTFLANISDEHTLVTSFYKQVYRRVGEVALERRVPVILVSDRGLLQTRQSRLFKGLHENTLVISPFAPDDVGTPSSGPRRDAIIIALADILVGLEIREGGTMDRLLTRAINKGKTVWIYKPKYITLNTTGNWKLIELGARPFEDVETVVVEIQGLI